MDATPKQTTEEFVQTMGGVTQPLIHAVTLRFRDDAAPEAIEQALAAATHLGEIPGVTNWSVHESLDQRKGRRVLLMGTLSDGQALLAYRQHPLHQAFLDIAQHIADWDTVDFVAS